MSTSFKQILQTNEMIPVFCMARVMHPIVIEMYGLAGGFRGFWIEQEHASITNDHVVTASLAARANQMDCFVRMPPTGYWQVTQCLEAGAGGVMGAQIQNATHAAEFLSWTKFAPDGKRGINMSGRDADYTFKPISEFAVDANRDGFVAIQIETLGALRDADEIAALDGVDLLFVGPADLSLAMGVVGQFHHEKLWDGIAHVSRACQRHGKAWGAVVPDPKFADRAVELGCRMPSIGGDILALRRGIEAMKSAFSGQF